MISKEQLENLRARYPVGSRVELVKMNDPYTKLKPGDQGVVSIIDDCGTIFAVWDCGSSLGIVFDEDYAVRVDM